MRERFKSSLILIWIAITSALIGSTILLLIGELSNLIGSVGYFGMFFYVIIGLLPGILIFSLIGYGIDFTKTRSFIIGLVVTILMLLIFFIVAVMTNFVIPYIEYGLLGALVSVPFMLVTSIFYHSFVGKKSGKGLILSALITEVFSLILIYIIAIVYLGSGETTMPVELLTLSVISLLFILSFYFAPK